MKYKLLAFLFVLVGCLKITSAQEQVEIFNPESSKVSFFGSGYGFSIGVGSLGPGLSLNKRLSSHFSLNIGYSNLGLKQQTELTFDNEMVVLNADVTLGAISLLVDYHPFKSSSFRLTGGVAKNLNNYSVTITPKNDVKYGEIVLPKEDVGNLVFTFNSNEYAPYLGFGFGRAIPKHRVGVGFDVGCYYHGNPTANIKASGAFGPTATKEKEEQLQKAFDGWAFYPYVNLKLNVKLVK